MSCSNQIELKLAVSQANTGADAIKRAPIVEENTGVRCLRIGDVSNNRNFEEWGFTSADEDVIEKFQLKKDDIVIARTGNTIGVVKYIDKDIKSVYNNGLIRIKINENFNPKFIYYNLISEKFKSFIYGISAGTSTQPNMKIDHMLQYKITDFNIEEQEKIANILSSLDDKIELNNEMNKTLEEMAQSIFEKWFVDFEFPNEDGQPYKSSGGEMVESELGMIPKGWEVKDLDEILDSISIKHKFPNEKIIFLNTSDILDGEVLHNNYSDVSSLPGQAKKSIQKGDILYSEIRPKNKRYTFIDFDADEYVVSTKLMVLRTKNKFNSSMMYFYLSNESTVNYLQTIAEGRSGTFPQITFNELKKLKICMPTNDTIVELGKFFENILKTINNNKKEAKQLKEMRDILLLKLMSGEIRV